MFNLWLITPANLIALTHRTFNHYFQYPLSFVYIFCLFIDITFHLIKLFSIILSTRLLTNVLYFLLYLNRCIIALSVYAHIFLILNLIKLHFIFPTKFEGLYATASPSRGIDTVFLDN